MLVGYKVQKANGVVSQIQQLDRAMGYKSWMYRVSFEANNGQSYFVESSFSTNKPPDIGTQLVVVYCVDEPVRAYIRNSDSFFPIVILGFILAIGLLIFFFGDRR
jgi:hypothetical protein